MLIIRRRRNSQASLYRRGTRTIYELQPSERIASGRNQLLKIRSNGTLSSFPGSCIDMVASFIARRNTKFHDTISVEERLALT